MMVLKKFTLSILCFLTLILVTASASASKPISCIVFDYINARVTPLSVSDPPTKQSSSVTTLQQCLQTIETIKEWQEYVDKIQKLRAEAAGLIGNLKQEIEAVKVTDIESTTKGTQTLIDGFKGKAPDVAGGVVDFEDAATTEQAISKVAVVADPVGAVEDLALKERKDAFIQQSFIDLHADILVAKAKLADLKKSDSDAQGSSSTPDTNGNDSLVIRMKNFENQVQVLEEKIQSMRIVLEGIKNLKSAKTLKEEVSVGESK